MSKSSGFPSRRNQSKRILRAAILATPAIAALSLVGTANAANLYWDINGTTAGAGGATAAGTWSTTATNWSTDLAGAATTAAWVGAGDVPIFSAGTNATGGYTVTVSGTVTTDGLRAEEGTVTLSGGTINLNTNSIVTAATGTATTTVINSVVTGTNGLSVTRQSSLGTTGTPVLTLGGANTYSGTTTIDAAGTLSTVLQVTLNNNAALGATGSGNGTVFGASAPSDAAFIALPGNRLITEDLQLRGGGQGSASLGQLRNTAGVNTWAGNIVMNGLINNLGTGLASLGGSTGTLVVTGLISSLNAGANTAGVAWGKMGAGTTILRGTTPNTNVGLVRNFNGILEIQADGALGTATVDGSFDGATLQLVNNANTIAFRAPPSSGGFAYTVNEGLTTAGPTAALGFGFGTNAQIDNFGGANTFAGFIRLGGSSQTGPTRVLTTLGAVTGSSLELSGNLYASTSGAGTTPAIPDPREIHKIGGGNLIISGTNDTNDGVTSGDSDQYKMHGTFVIDAGTVTLRSTNPVGGAFAGSTNGPMNFQVNLGGTLSLDNSLAVNTARVGATAAITLSAGEVKLIGNTTSSVNQPAGGLSVASYSTITIDQPTNTNGATTTFSLGTLARSNRGTALLRGINNTSGFAAMSGTLKGAGGAAGTNSISILTEVVGDTSSTGDGTDFVTIDSGFARILTGGEYAALTNGNTDLKNTTVTANTAITGNTTVNSIKLSGGNTVTVSSGQTLLVNSGGILGVGAGTSNITGTGGNLSFETTHVETDGFTGDTFLVVDSANEGIITVPLGSSLTIDTNVHGDQGLTKSGRGTLRLTGTNDYGANIQALTPAPKTTINAGVLEFNVDANLGNPACDISINGGTLRPLSTSTSARDISLDSPGVNTIDTGTGANLTVTGIVSGGRLTKDGAGVLALTNTSNTYTGGTQINAGTMYLDSANPLQPTFGTGGITLNGGVIRTDVTMTLDKSLTSTSTNTTGGFYIASGAILTYGSGPTSTVGMGGSGTYAINGGGVLRLSQNTGANMTYTGRLIVNDGSTLAFDAAGTNTIAGIGGASVAPAEWVVLNSNSRLQFTVTSNLGTGFSASTRGITVNNSGIIDITGTNIVINTTSITGSGATNVVYKDGTGLYSLRVSNPFSGKWNVLQGTLEFGAPTNNAASLGTGSGADFITIANGATLQATTTSATGSTAANQGITLAGGTGTIGAKIGSTITFNGAITGSADLKIGGDGFPIVGNTSPQQLGGVVVLGSASSNYSGNTSIVGRHTTTTSTTVRSAALNALPTATNLTLDAGTGQFATFDLGTGATSFDQTVASVNKVGAGTVKVTNSGTNAATFTVNNTGTNSYTGTLTGNLNFAHTGSGTFELAAPGNTYTGTTSNALGGTLRVPLGGSIPANTNVTNFGTFEVFEDADLGDVDGGSTMNVGNGTNAKTTQAKHVRQTNVNVANNAKLKLKVNATPFNNGANSSTSKVTALTVGSSAFVDMTNTKLITQDASFTTTTYDGVNDIYIYDGIHGQVQKAVNPVGGSLYDGTEGITTTQTDATGGNTLTAIAVGNGMEIRPDTIGSPTDTELFSGQTIRGDSTIVMYTWGGDATMDGKLDGEDYFYIDSNAPLTGTVFGWHQGDFNYDGKIDGADYFYIDGNVAFQQGSGNVFYVRDPERGGGGGGLAAVPEPGSIGVLAVGALGLLGRRSRRKN